MVAVMSSKRSSSLPGGPIPGEQSGMPRDGGIPLAAKAAAGFGLNHANFVAGEAKQRISALRQTSYGPMTRAR